MMSPNLKSASTLLIINQFFGNCPETPFLQERAERVLGGALLLPNIYTKSEDRSVFYV